MGEDGGRGELGGGVEGMGSWVGLQRTPKHSLLLTPPSITFLSLAVKKANYRTLIWSYVSDTNYSQWT